MSEARVKFLRCKNGNGKIFDNAESVDSFVDAKSSLHQNASVFDSDLYTSKVINANVARSLLRNCYVTNSNLFGVYAEDSIFACELVSTKTKIINSHVLDRSRVTGFASLNNVRFKRLTVSGRAVLRNWQDEAFDGKLGYIGFGVWDRPPRVIRIKDLTITESISGFAYVGCYHRSVAEWLHFGERIGLTFGVTLKEVKKIRKFLQSL